MKEEEHREAMEEEPWSLTLLLSLSYNFDVPFVSYGVSNILGIEYTVEGV